MGNLVSTVNTNTIVGWTVVITAFGAYWYLQKEKQRQKAARVASTKSRHERPIAAPIKREPKEAKPKRQRLDDAKRDSYASKAKAQPQQSQSYPTTFTPDDDAVDNREFARALSGVKQGTKFTAKAKDDARQKSVKQSRAQLMDEPVAPTKASPPSSTGGNDGDDDQSSISSPTMRSAETAIADMLEQPAPGPSVLRLTDTEEKKKQQQRAVKAPEQVETKKQRQNRKKVEAAKAAREEAEKERRAKQEAQRRLARQSEGRAAKDGSSFMAAQAAASNAWKDKSAQTMSKSDTNGFQHVQPLDTFEAAAPTKASTPKPAKPSNDKTDEWATSLPSEEEQMDMIRKETEGDEWSTVKSKPRKTKSKKTEATESSDDLPSNKNGLSLAPEVLQPVTKPQSRPVKAFHQQSSFALLKTEETAEDDDEEEEEWDV